MASHQLNLNIDDELYKNIEHHLDNGNFEEAVKTSILYLTQCIRDRTDLELDGEKLITKSFSTNNPKIRLTNLSTETEISEQTGHMMILQGIYKSYRNPLNHNIEKKIDSFDCNSIITLINFYIKLIKKAKSDFEIEDFLKKVFDPYFLQTVEYADELVNTIPKKKLSDINNLLLKQIDDSNSINIAYILISSLKLYSDDELNKIHEKASNLLHTSTDFEVLKVMIFVFKNSWNKITKAAKLRIENFLINLFQNLTLVECRDVDQDGDYYSYPGIGKDGELCRYINQLPKPYSMKQLDYGISIAIEKKLNEGGEIMEFTIKCFHDRIFKDNEFLYPKYSQIFCNLLKKNEKYIFQLLSTVVQVGDEEFEPQYHFDKNVSNEMVLYQKRHTESEDANNFFAQF